MSIRTEARSRLHRVGKPLGGCASPDIVEEIRGVPDEAVVVQALPYGPGWPVLSQTYGKVKGHDTTHCGMQP